jgi:hypothetical protein
MNAVPDPEGHAGGKSSGWVCYLVPIVPAKMILLAAQPAGDG